MSLWTMIAVIVAVVAITVVKVVGLITRHPPPPPAGDGSAADKSELIELRERIKVLERIAADSHSIEARESRRIAEEIETLRGPQG